MKINLIDYIKKVGDATSLSTLEREKLEGVLMEYKAMKPLRVAESAQDKRRTGAKENFFSGLFFMHSKRKYIPIAIVLGLLLSGTASYAAEGSMPGDLLYPVKVSVNEKVGGALALSPESKAKLQAKLAERRLLEATNLAAEDKLTADVSAELSSDFSTHADSAVEYTKELEKKDAAIAIGFASNFESNLVAHEELLADSKGDTGALRTVVRAKALLISKLRMDAEGDAEVSARSATKVTARKASGVSESVKVDTRVKADTAFAMGRAVKTAIKDTEDLLARANRKLEASAIVNAQAQIKAATELSAKGDTLFKTSDFTGAFHAYQDALVTMKKLAVYLGASGGVNIKIADPVKDSSSEGAHDGTSKGTEADTDMNTPPKSREILPIEIKTEVPTGVHIEANTGGAVNVGGSGNGSVNIGL
ncbi:MAG: DUF5667 domain-containing protein [Candidatus Paceibacterota bacterium]